MKKFIIQAGIVASALALNVASASLIHSVNLDFEGEWLYEYPGSSVVISTSLLNGFYNGGTDSLGLSGTDLGVDSTGVAKNVIGVGNPFKSPGGGGVGFSIPINGPAIFSFESGFDSIEFDSMAWRSAQFEIYSEANALGDLIFSGITAWSNTFCYKSARYQRSCWEENKVDILDIAKSIKFLPPKGYALFFDDITFSNSKAHDVSEPKLFLLFLLLSIFIIFTTKRRVVSHY